MAQTEPMAGAWHCAGTVSPSSDSGLGSEDEQLSGVSAEYEQLAADLTRALATETAGGEQGGDQGGESLSLLLTSANPARIDVRTLRRSKVRLSEAGVRLGGEQLATLHHGAVNSVTLLLCLTPAPVTQPRMQQSVM